jgi:hypothetical protein
VKYWICVVNNNRSLETVRDELNSWFCLPKSANKKDFLLFYLSGKVSKSENGIQYSSEILSLNDNLDNSKCNAYGYNNQNLFQFFIKKAKKLNYTVKLTQLKKENLFSHSQFISRNAQGTCFEINMLQYKKILEMSNLIN